MIISIEKLNKLKNYAKSNGISIKQALDEILGAVLEKESGQQPTDEELEAAKKERLKKLGLLHD
ncbi:MAG: hypothetical protein HUJ54_14005 [Erysipelotrichaceae bacterium]|nr:hypothetical protein [Erysipelotrichaceae bacterium]